MGKKVIFSEEEQKNVQNSVRKKMEESIPYMYEIVNFTYAEVNSIGQRSGEI